MKKLSFQWKTKQKNVPKTEAHLHCCSWGPGPRQSCCQGPGNSSLQKLWASRVTWNSRAAERWVTNVTGKQGHCIPGCWDQAGKKKNKQCPLSSLSLGPTSFQAISIPFCFLVSFINLCQMGEGKIKGRTPSTAGEARCLLCHAPLFPLPEGVLTLEYSSLAVSSCLLLPEW